MLEAPAPTVDAFALLPTAGTRPSPTLPPAQTPDASDFLRDVLPSPMTTPAVVASPASPARMVLDAEEPRDPRGAPDTPQVPEGDGSSSEEDAEDAEAPAPAPASAATTPEEKPADDASAADASSASDESFVWREGYDENHKRLYYFNTETGESRWTPPEDPFRPYDPDRSSSSDYSESESSSSGDES